MARASERVLIECLQIMMKPLARFCVRHSLTVKELLEAGKVALLEAADDEMKRAGQKVNISRLAVITGIHRRDVMRLHRDGSAVEEPQSLVSRILGQWEQAAEFQTPTGKPKVLTTEGDDSDFRRLVMHVSQDLNPGTVLFQLERIGAIEKTRNGIRLRRQAHSVKDLKEGFLLASHDVEDLLETVQENLASSDEVPQLHGRTEYDNIYVNDLPEIRKWLLSQGTEFHKKVRNFLSKFDRDLNPDREGDAGGRVVLGTFGRVSNQMISDNTDGKDEK